MLQRRSFIIGATTALLGAPSIVQAKNLMPIKPVKPKLGLYFHKIEMINSLNYYRTQNRYMHLYINRGVGKGALMQEWQHNKRQGQISC